MADFNTFTVELKMPDENQAEQNLKQICATLFNESQLCDVTISCKDGQIQAHRMILSSVSPYLYKLFTSTPWPNPCSHPVILLRNSRVEDVRVAMDLIYTGAAKNIRKDKLQALMEVGRELECPSMIRAIETAVQNCGVAMFRRLVSNNVMAIAPITRNKSTEATHSPVLKQDVEIVETQSHIQSQTSEGAYTLSIPKLPNSGLRKIEKKSSVYAKINGQATGGSLLKAVSQTPPEASVNQVRGETFVYTNKDLGLEFNEQDSQSWKDEQTKTPTESGALHMNGSASASRLLKRKRTQHTEHHYKKISCLEVEPDSVEDSDPASCPWCLQVFTNIPLLQRHIKTHVGVNKPKFVCSYCNTEFGRSAHLKRHLRTHTGEKPYQCSICATRFARQDKLKIHLERHLQNASSAASNGTNDKHSESEISHNTESHMSFPIKVLIPTQAHNTSSSGSHYNGGGSPPATIRKSSPITPPSKFSASMRYETVGKNLSPSTTITTVTSARHN